MITDVGFANMLHTTIYLKLTEIFPICAEDIVKWWQNGKNSIRVKFVDGDIWVFTYRSAKNWKLETLDSWTAEMQNRLC